MSAATAGPVPPRRTGAATIADTLATDNAIVAAVGADDRRDLLQGARTVRLVPRRILIQPRTEISTVLFPTSGMVSLVTDLGRGATVEVGLIGVEGVVGARPVLLHRSGFANVRAQAMTAGTAIAVPVPDFLRELERSSQLRELVQGFVDLQFTQTIQEVACNRAHRADQRLARWLLHADDRSPDRSFAMTQDFLSRVLGVRRATVTEAMGSLRDAGIVHTQRGIVTILDRRGLEGAACDCYPILAAALRDHLEACLRRAEPPRVVTGGFRPSVRMRTDARGPRR